MEHYEASRSGNSLDPLDADWTDPSIAEFTDDGDIRGWWLKLTQATGIDDFMFRRMLDAQIEPELHETLVKKVIELRPTILHALRQKGLDLVVNRFDPETFNPSVPLGGNLLYAAPRQSISQADLVEEGRFLSLIVEQGLGEDVIAISQTVVETLHQTFGKDGTAHPLFQALGIDNLLYEKLAEIAGRRSKSGDSALNEDEFALLLTVPFLFTAEQIGPAFPESFKEDILTLRRERGAELRERAADLFVPIGPQTYLPRMSLLENLIYGRVSGLAGAREDMVRDVVAEVLEQQDMKQLVAETIWDLETGTGGNQLPKVFLERSAFSRAAIKRPDILILNKAIASHNAESRSLTREKLRELLPDSTLIFMEDEFNNKANYDIYIEIRNGHIDGFGTSGEQSLNEDGIDDLQRKQDILARTPVFEDLEARNQRLLAFSAQWFQAKAGQTVFTQGEIADAVYLCINGEAELSWLKDDGSRTIITQVEPGRMIGDLAVIMGEDRKADFIAKQDTTFLRIGADEFRSVVETDAHVAFSLLRTVSGHLQSAAEHMRDSGLQMPQLAFHKAAAKFDSAKGTD